MTENTYNGFTNYETWAVALWIDDNQTSYHYWREEARRHREKSPKCQFVLDGIWPADQAAKYTLADQIRDEVRDGAPLDETTLYADLLNAALAEVNWQEIAENILADMDPPEDPVFGPVISAYSRAQAIADGILVDVSEMAREAGISIPTAVTAGLWAEYVKVPDGVEGQDEKGRLWDILSMFYCTARRGLKGDRVLFDVLVRNDNTAPRPVAIKAICGPGDEAEPVLTMMLPYED